MEAPVTRCGINFRRRTFIFLNVLLCPRTRGYAYTENPEWIIWLIWAIVCHYRDKKTLFSHIFESFCPCTDPLWLKWVKWFTWVFLCRRNNSTIRPRTYPGLTITLTQTLTKNPLTLHPKPNFEAYYYRARRLRRVFRSCAQNPTQLEFL